MRSPAVLVLVVILGCRGDTTVTNTDGHSALVEVNDSNFVNEVLKSDQPVLVDFWAPWCGPCLQLTPIVEELAAEFAGRAKIVKLN